MPTITAKDGTELYYKDWGSGQPVVFSHGWPLSADAWERPKMIFLGDRGYRCIAHDRRGHGRSSQPWAGNDMDTFADDLATLVDKLDIRDAIHVGHSIGVEEKWLVTRSNGFTPCGTESPARNYGQINELKQTSSRFSQNETFMR